MSTEPNKNNKKASNSTNSTVVSAQQEASKKDQQPVQSGVDMPVSTSKKTIATQDGSNKSKGLQSSVSSQVDKPSAVTQDAKKKPVSNEQPNKPPVAANKNKEIPKPKNKAENKTSSDNQPVANSKDAKHTPKQPISKEGGKNDSPAKPANKDLTVKKSIDSPNEKKSKPKWLSSLVSMLLFLLLVIAPWVLVINYVTTIAHPRYISKSGVVVKQVSDTTVSTGSGIGALLGVNSTSVEDAKYLTEYILSNDMIKKLDGKFDFQNAYYIDGSDIIYELPENASQEELLKYFKKRVRIDLDEQTNVLTVTTEAFNPEYALELNKAILTESEQFVNRISQQIATDQLQYSQAQLLESQDRLDNAKSKLLTYQNQNQVFDPQTNVQMVNQVIGNLQAQLSSLRTEERQLLSYLNPEAPQIVSIRSQIKSVQEQIQVEQGKLTSPSSNSKLNEQTIQFEAIKQEVEFATELYKISLSSLEKARLEAFRKMKNLIVISAPYEAEEALYPRVQYIIWTSLVLLLIFYGFIRLVLSVIKDHSG